VLAATPQCDACHNKYPSLFKPIKKPMNHTGVAGQCSTCHTPAYAFSNANSQGVSHIPTSAQCDNCHKTGYVDWTVSLANMNHTVVAATPCSTCHSGGFVSEKADPKGATHIPTTATCNSCHTSTTDWTIRTMNHTVVNTTLCSTCHSGAYLSENAQAKGLTHVPETRNCSVCHTSTTVWTQRTYVHPTTATGTCQLCHNGAYLSENAQNMPINHIPTTLSATWASCDACHKVYTAWTGGTLHKAPASQPSGTVAAKCGTCHIGPPIPYLGPLQGPQSKTPHNATKPAKGYDPMNCTKSGCHNPSKFTNWSP
jgi:hypothetical protein